ncbi:MAG: phosphoribosylformylglycinamidine synthase subunit PurL [Leptospirales bacterium]
MTTAASRFRIPSSEMAMIHQLIGRDPTLTEEAIFSAMWSEHCSYKSSRIHLRSFSSRHPRVQSGPGENAGIVHLRNGVCLAFKMESHNHPSFLEPFQGAATGVGGILRDVIAMGAKPIALENSLVFGSLRHPRHRTLFRRVVEGIAGYGNPIGVPTVGGEIWFDDRYKDNILVNVMAVGVVMDHSIMSAKATQEGLQAIYIGNRTGRDGVSGAAMASRGFSSDGGDLRPQVQIADPYAGKNLMEATLEIARLRLADSIQDMGAAGLTSSSTEMAGRAGLGMEIDISKVPLRDFSMEPWEILLSESQERMLVLSRPENVAKIMDIATHWHLSSAVVGQTISTQNFIVRKEGVILADLPISHLTENAPLYNRPSQSPVRHRMLPISPALSGTHSLSDIFRRMLDHPNGGDPKWIYRHFDFEVQTRTLLGPGHDTAVLDLKDQKKTGVAISVVSLPHACSRDPYRGGALLVAKAVTELAAVGAFPLAMTDCLNFGNPENPLVMGSFQDAVRGIAEAGIALDIPVISGNVSLYNETNGTSIPPTPMIGITGLIPSVRFRISGQIPCAGLRIAIVGRTQDLALGGSYLDWILEDALQDAVPAPRYDEMKGLTSFMISGVQSGRISSARAIGRGGLMRSLLLMVAHDAPLGAFLDLVPRVDPLPFFFSEAPGRIIVAYHPDEEHFLMESSSEWGVPFQPTGYSAQNTWIARYQDIEGVRKEWTDSLPGIKYRYKAALSKFMEELP